MSLYILQYSLIFIATLLKYKFKFIPDYLEKLIFILLLLFLCFRYGQGTDYFGYKFVFEQANKLAQQSNMFSIVDFQELHGEYGWLFILYLLNKFRINYEVLIFLISLYEMFMLKRFLDTYSSNKMLSWLLLLPVIYLVYFFSALRQGLVIATFLGLMIPLVIKNKLVKYYILVFICILIHKGAIVLTPIPFILHLRVILLEYFLIVAFIIGIIVFKYMYFVPYSDIGKFSYFAIMERLFMMSYVFYIYHNLESSDNISPLLYRVYIYSICIYFIFMSNDLAASRFSWITRCVEIVLIPNLLRKYKHASQYLITVLLLLNFFMFVKNINSEITDGLYYSNISFWNYPYVSIFNNEDIYKYRYNKYITD